MQTMADTQYEPRPFPAEPVRRRTDVRVQELDDEALVYDPATADTHYLNPTALFIWRHCDGTYDADSIAGRLSQVYDVPVEEAAVHVARLLRDLSDRGLIPDAGGESRRLESGTIAPGVL